MKLETKAKNRTAVYKSKNTSLKFDPKKSTKKKFNVFPKDDLYIKNSALNPTQPTTESKRERSYSYPPRECANSTNENQEHPLSILGQIEFTIKEEVQVQDPEQEISQSFSQMSLNYNIIDYDLSSINTKSYDSKQQPNINISFNQLNPNNSNETYSSIDNTNVI